MNNNINIRGGLIQLVAHGASDMWYMTTNAGANATPYNVKKYNSYYFLNTPQDNGIMTIDNLFDIYPYNYDDNSHINNHQNA